MAATVEPPTGEVGFTSFLGLWLHPDSVATAQWLFYGMIAIIAALAGWLAYIRWYRRPSVYALDVPGEPLFDDGQHRLQAQHQATVDDILAGGAEMNMGCRLAPDRFAQLPHQYRFRRWRFGHDMRPMQDLETAIEMLDHGRAAFHPVAGLP